MDISQEKCMALTTFRRNGEGVTTPVWVNRASDGRIGFWTSMGSGKTKRMRNNATVTVQPCSYSGKPKKGTGPTGGTAEMVRSGPLFDEVQEKGKKKYGVLVPLARFGSRLTGMRPKDQEYADTVVLIALEG